MYIQQRWIHPQDFFCVDVTHSLFCPPAANPFFFLLTAYVSTKKNHKGILSGHAATTLVSVRCLQTRLSGTLFSLLTKHLFLLSPVVRRRLLVFVPSLKRYRYEIMDRPAAKNASEKLFYGKIDSMPK